MQEGIRTVADKKSEHFGDLAPCSKLMSSEAREPIIIQKLKTLFHGSASPGLKLKTYQNRSKWSNPTSK
ncbi:unnamed protein product [Sphenostylis stenocarpa]|uniref:Uncharacterized protein n=1 Tax=Sphenostylis stenocarpa TaxID=92480 RepID=A0AA86TFU2_9FABA|nr:unnamed protein product [Sphenostylis stenocarpa]